MILLSILIREYIGFGEKASEYDVHNVFSLSEGFTDQDPISPDSVMVDIEGIHVGPTRNFTRYTEKALKESVPTWTNPYKRPLIMHHNEKDGKIIGRIIDVKYTDVGTRSGTGALVFTVNIPDEVGKEQVCDGRLMTPSIGVIAHDVRCSICGHNIAEYGPCEHKRGQEYEEGICYWDVYSMEGKELSYVIVPSDIYAKNIRIYKPTETGVASISESFNNIEGVKSMNLEQEVKNLQESLNALQQENEQLKAECNSIKEEKSAIEGELENVKKENESLKEENAKLKKDLKEAQDTLKDKESKLEEETQLRESLENELVKLNNEKKDTLVEHLMYLRKLAGKPEGDKASLQERTQESLCDAILDLKEELSALESARSITKVEDPTLSNEKQNEPNVKKQNAASNMDLEEGLQKLFDTVVGAFNK